MPLNFELAFTILITPASFGEVASMMIPIVAIVMGVGAGIIKIMTNHQQKMAEIVNKPLQDQALLQEVNRLRGEVAELRDRVNQQVIDRDSRSSLNLEGLSQAPPSSPQYSQDTQNLGR
jgi:hypothetical protein